MSRNNAAMASILTLLSVSISVVILYRCFWDHPLNFQAEVIQLKPFVPTRAGKFNTAQWERLPFFYTLGAWPKRFKRQPITYAFAYRKGLPKTFPASIRAHWGSHVEVRIEPPFTPREDGNAFPTDQIMACLTSGWNTPMGGSVARCQKIRQRILEPQYKRLVKEGASELQVAWFMVANPHLPVAERAQGLFLSGRSGKHLFDRYVLISPTGSQQAMMLKRPDSGTLSIEAKRLMEKIIGSIQLQDNLNSGRALINQSLSKSSVPTAAEMADPAAYLSKLTHSQALLLAKISVDPKDLMAYYHLGGTSYFIARYAAQQRMRSTQIVSSYLLELLDNATETAVPTLNSAWRYAKDLKPESQYTAKLHEHWLEIKSKKAN